MFQRLKGFNLDFLDNKIAEEQAKQRAQQQSPSRRTASGPAGPRRTSARTDSPGKRPHSRLRVSENGDGTTAKGPDPSEFVIDDDSEVPSRATTPRPVKEDGEDPLGAAVEEKTPEKDREGEKEKGKEREQEELSEDVRKKLARLDKLERKYQDLLRNYRTAHARVSSIEPFEASLRENTPLTSISDPGALIEYLSQINLKGDMVMDELKRVSGENKEIVKERDELKAKLEEAENETKKAYDEAAGLRKERDEQSRERAVPALDGAAEAPKDDSTATRTEADPLGVNGTNEQHATTSTSETQPPASRDSDADSTFFFSYETELPKLETELRQRSAYIEELSTENATLRNDLDMCQLDLEAMKNKIRITTSELSSVKAELENAHQREATAIEEHEGAAATLVATESEVVVLQEKLKQYQKSLDEKNKELTAKAAAAEENLKKYQEEHKKNLNTGVYENHGEKRIEILNSLVKDLKEQVKVAEDAKKEIGATSLWETENLKAEAQRLQTELRVSEEAASRSKVHEDAVASLKKRLQLSESERDEAQRLAESKKGHEAAVASLRSQLKKVEKDRDAAYKMILDCGRCPLPEKDVDEERALGTPTNDSTSTSQSRSRGASEATENTEASTQPTEVSTASLDGDSAGPAAAKKSKKKKSKAKKKSSVDTTADGKESEPVNNIIDLLKKGQTSSKAGNANPELTVESIRETLSSMREANDADAEQKDELIKHHEEIIEKRGFELMQYKRAVQEKDEEIMALHHSIGEKEAAIERLDKKLKDEDELKEEIEELRGELIEIGQQATDAKHEKQQLVKKFEDRERGDEEDKASSTKKLKEAQHEQEQLREKIKTLEDEIEQLKQSHDAKSKDDLRASQEKVESVEREKNALQMAKDACEKQIEELKAQHSANGAELDAKHTKIMADFDELKSKAATVETDLAAANQLAQSRYKDLTDVREHLNKIQPEMKTLREEAAELKIVKQDLEKSSTGLRKLEAKEKDLRSEIAEYKSQVTDKDSEIRSLCDKVKQGNEHRSALEETCDKVQKDLQRTESAHKEVVEARDKLQADLKKAQEEVKTSRSKLEDLEKQVDKLTSEAANLRDELQLKSAQQASAQSLMDSMQDQDRELATQMKEVRARCESLEEELADSHRLLSERSREGETMRRLLADVEGRAESRVKEMRDRMDLAVEERDRAEDEASGIGRRKAREIEDLKNRLRDVERDASRATEAREEAERREGEFRTLKGNLERRAAQAQEEVEQVRSAMAQLRDALDDGEKQARDLENQKTGLRNTIQERDVRLEKLQKSSKSMAEELRTLQAVHKNRQNSLQSSRSSVDSSRVSSPAPKTSNGQPIATTGGPDAKETVDYVYLKNVLLQFLEQKEKKHQMQLVPVLGMLLHFDKKDEKKWMTAISAK